MKWLRAWASCLCAALTLSFFSVNTCRGDTVHKDIDIVIILDTSGSMMNSDPERRMLEAAKLFVGLIAEHKDSKDQIRVGILTFNTDIKTTLMPTGNNSMEDAGVLMNEIDNIVYEKDSDTDIGLALKKGVDILAREQNPNTAKAIVLFTDGKIELGDAALRRSAADSEQDVKRAVSDINRSYPVYTIGLNTGFEVDEEMLEQIAAGTGDEDNCYIIDSSTNLDRIFLDIYCEIKGIEYPIPEPVVNHQVKIDIPDTTVIQANVMLYPDQPSPIHHVSLKDPSGAEVPVDGSAAAYVELKSHSLLKLFHPSPGIWTETIDESSSVEYYLMYSYDIALTMELDADMQRLTGEPVDVSSALSYRREELEDTSFLDQVVLTVTDPDGGSKEYEMTSLGNGSAFAGAFTPDKPGDYQVCVTARGNDYLQTSESVAISVTEPPAAGMSGVAILAAAFTVAAIGGAAFLFIKKRRSKKGFFGQLRYRIETGGELVVENTCNLNGRRGSVKLGKLVTSNVGRALELDKVALYPYTDLYTGSTGISIVSRSKAICSVYPTENGIVLMDGEHMELQSPAGEARRICLTVWYSEEMG